MPFLWVVPLSLYLVTFIIAFDHPRWYWPTAFAIFTLLTVYRWRWRFTTGQSHVGNEGLRMPENSCIRSQKEFMHFGK